MDLQYLTELISVEGPVATVYLDTSRTTEDAVQLIETRWRGLRETLQSGGADEETLAVMDGVVGKAGVPGPHGQVVVAAHGQVLLAETLPAPPRREIARWSWLPHLMPFVAQRGDAVPHVVVVADRVGADVTAYGHVGPDEPSDEESVEGRDYPIHKVPGGGWSHDRWQRSVEDVWEKNAAEVARAVDRFVARFAARLVVAAGDVRALAALEEHLGEPARDRLVRVDEGARGPGADLEPLRRHVAQLVAEIAARDMLSTVEEWRKEHDGHGRAVQGMADTVGALRRAQVDTLLLNDDPTSTATLWAGPDPLSLGLTRDELTGLGVEDPFQDRADAVLVRALAASGAGVVMVPADQLRLTDGLGAVLRYADASSGA